MVGIDAGKGKGPIYPTDSTVRTGTYAPLSRPEFIYINAQSANSPVIQDFVRFYMENAPQLVQEVGYVPLPAEAYRLSTQRFQNKKRARCLQINQLWEPILVELLKEDQ